MEDRFAQPMTVSALDLQFGGDMLRLMPGRSLIPDEFKSFSNKQVQIIGEWFFRGLPEGTRFIPREGIDENKALRHIGAILRSFEPKHEHKTAACAYLLDKWFSDIQIPELKSA